MKLAGMEGVGGGGGGGAGGTGGGGDEIQVAIQGGEKITKSVGTWRKVCSTYLVIHRTAIYPTSQDQIDLVNRKDIQIHSFIHSKQTIW